MRDNSTRLVSEGSHGVVASDAVDNDPRAVPLEGEAGAVCDNSDDSLRPPAPFSGEEVRRKLHA